jgi:hypothetical protein
VGVVKVRVRGIARTGNGAAKFAIVPRAVLQGLAIAALCVNLIN